MTEETLKELLTEEIRDLYDAEKQITKALPRLAKAAESEALAEALKAHLEETVNQVSRLENVFELLGENAKGKPCKGMKGLLEEGSEILKEEDKGAPRDLAIIAACQKVEHYEVSAYGTCRTMAEYLELTDVAELLQQTENEEEAADSKLTEVATSLYEATEEDAEGEEAEDEEVAPVGAGRTQSRRKAS